MTQPLTDKQQYWSHQLQRVQDSGLSIADYARANDIPVQKLYQWRSTLKSISTTVTHETKFTRVVTSNPVSRYGLQIHLPGARLQFSVLPEPDWVAQLLSNANALQ